LRQRSRALLVALSVLGLLLIAPQPCHAHPDLDRGIKLATEAEFSQALTAFAQGLESGTLTRDELIVLLSERVLVLHALGKRAELERDLSALAMLDPSRAFDRRAPPELREIFAAKRDERDGPLSLEVRCDLDDGDVHIGAHATGTWGVDDLSLRIHARGPGEVRYTQFDTNEIDLTPETEGNVDYYAELVGFGGIVIATAGTLDDPRHCGEGDALAGGLAAPSEERDGSNRKLWWWIGAGGALAITAVAVAIVVTRDPEPSDKTMISRPMVTFE
jgi:hypothetical protein